MRIRNRDVARDRMHRECFAVDEIRVVCYTARDSVGIEFCDSPLRRHVHGERWIELPFARLSDRTRSGNKKTPSRKIERAVQPQLQLMDRLCVMD